MDNSDRPEDLLARIDTLVERSIALPDAPQYWEQRLYIDFELVLLFRRLADAVEGDSKT